MTNNYVGPGWYWVENHEAPLFLGLAETGNVCVHDAQAMRWFSHIRGQKIKILAHIPRPSQRPVVDWSVMPAWAKWVAMDQDGRWMWYAYMPCQDEESGVWLGDDSVPLDALDGTLPKQCTPTYTGDWRNSLVERPE